MAGKGSGAGMLPAILAVSVGGFLVLTAGSLFATGIAQRELWPRLKARLQAETARVTGKAPSAAPADSSFTESPEDSLRALRAQVETQRRLLEAEREELVRARTGIDSVMNRFAEAQGTEAARQARLLAKMDPRAAGAILARMDDAGLRAVLLRMPDKAASKVLAVLDPERVAVLHMDELELDALDEVPFPGEPAGMPEGAPTPEHSDAPARTPTAPATVDAPHHSDDAREGDQANANGAWEALGASR